MQTSPAHLTLSPDQKQAFIDEGYLVLDNLFDPTHLDPVIAEIQEQVDQLARELYAQGKLPVLYETQDFAHRLACISRHSDVVARAIWNGSLSGPAFFNLICNTNLLDTVEAFTGPEIIASSVYRLRPKIPHYNYGAVPWHQDSGYFEPFCDNGLVLTIWIPLVDTYADNGCLWVIPRAHQGKVLPHHKDADAGYLVIDEENLPTEHKPVCCPVPKGGALLLHNRTPHVSFENKTDGVRWSMDLRYQSAALPTNAPISRLADELLPHGSDVSDPDYIPPACYPPEADFLVRSCQRPEQVLTIASAFSQLRREHMYRPVTARWGD
jgi:ectoine hydroxylase-related dioxygenase (phytanoyl-CoA dioxygenase family)